MMHRHTLSNGLQVIAETRTNVPMVTVWSWYRVGSGCETQGITGITHLCEHMNFKTSKAYPREGELDAAIAAWGGSINGYTWIDTTTHYSTVLKEGLDEALKVEAQRMHAMHYDTQSIETERGVVISEYNGGENDPEEKLDKAMTLAAFDAHGYRWPTIGMLSDLRTMTAQQVKDHYNQYFVPDNATLVVVGNFSWPDLKKKVQHHFGRIPAARFKPVPATAEPAQTGLKRVEVKGVGEVPYLSLAFHTPPADAPDLAAVLMLRGLLVGGGALGLAHGSYGSTRLSSLLYRALVEPGLAARVKAFFAPTRAPFVLGITAALHGEKDFDRAEASIGRVLRNLRRRPPGKKAMQNAAAQFNLAFRRQQERITARAENLGYFASIGNAAAWQRLQRAVLKQTPEDVMKAAQNYLNLDNGVIGRFLPQETPAPKTAWTRIPTMPKLPQPSRYAPRLPKAAKRCLPDFKLTAHRTALSNGLTVLTSPSRHQKTVTLHLLLPAGSSYQKGQGGEAELAARTCQLGTQSFGKKQILGMADALGTNIASYAGRQAAGISMTTLPEDVPKGLRLMLSMASEPAFDTAELKAEHRRLDNERRSMLEDPHAMAHRHLMDHLFRGHPYRLHPSGPDAGFPFRKKAILNFWRTHWQPAGSFLIVTGDVKQKDIVTWAEKATAHWQGKAPGKKRVALKPHPPAHTHKDMPGKTQTDIAMGKLLPARGHPDYPALQVLDRILGHIVLMGRLGARLRTEKGLAYYASSGIQVTRDFSWWCIYAGVAPQKVREAVKETGGVLKTLIQKGVTHRECALAQTGMVSGIVSALQTSGGLASLLATLALSDLPMDYFNQHLDRIKGLKKNKINEMAEKYCHPKDFTVITAGPAVNDQ